MNPSSSTRASEYARHAFGSSLNTGSKRSPERRSCFSNALSISRSLIRSVNSTDCSYRRSLRRRRLWIMHEMLTGWGTSRGRSLLYNVGRMKEPLKMVRVCRRVCSSCSVRHVVNAMKEGSCNAWTHQGFSDKPTKFSPLALATDHAVISVENSLQVCIAPFCTHEDVEPLG